jgi:hypothetical protein
MGLLVLCSWISRSKDEQADAVLMKNRSQMLIFGSMFVLLLFATVADFQLINTSLKANDLAMIEWVKSNIDENKTFLLSTGHEFSMSDPLQEWFPTLTDQHSVTTLQGLEWTLADEFFPWYEQLAQFQRCADVTCVDEWAAHNNLSYDYLIVMIPTETDDDEFVALLQSLGKSARSSTEYSLAYESERALVFEYKK